MQQAAENGGRGQGHCDIHAVPDLACGSSVALHLGSPTVRNGIPESDGMVILASTRRQSTEHSLQAQLPASTLAQCKNSQVGLRLYRGDFPRPLS